MNRYGIEVNLKHSPKLDPGYMPLYAFNHAFLKDAKQPLGLAVERAGGEMAVCETFIHGTPEMREADCYYVNRVVKTLLWMKGGFKIYVRGSEDIRAYLAEAYSARARAMACSATASGEYPGTRITRMPYFRAVSRSTLLNPAQRISSSRIFLACRISRV